MTHAIEDNCSAGSGFESILPGIMRWRSQLGGVHQPVNTYLWHQTLLIDPAADTPYPDVSVEAIAITHVQEEHIAGASHFSSVPLFVPASDAYLCEGAQAYERWIQKWEAPWDWDSRGNFQGHMAGARNERPPHEPIPIVGTLRESDEIEGLRVVATPGHGKGALTLVGETDGYRVAFCGDLICGDGQLWNWFDAEWDYGLQTGQKTLLASARKLLALEPDVLLPAHGEPLFQACQTLQRLIIHLENVLPITPENFAPLNFSDNDGPAPGWRTLSPHLYQWKSGNCALLVSRDGAGLLVDDGLCDWMPLKERVSHHREVMIQIKRALELYHIEAVAVTHFHGDHIYNIPMLLEDEPDAQVVTLDQVARVLSDPAAFNLSCPLPWYGAQHDSVPVHRIFGDGEGWHWHEYEIEWFHLGGQTFYHAGLLAYIDGARVAFVGDAIYGWNPGCDITVCYNDAEPSARGFAFSVDQLIARTPDLLVGGHGSVIRDPMPLLQQKRAAWQRQLTAFDALDFRHDRSAFFNPFHLKELLL